MDMDEQKLDVYDQKKTVNLGIWSTVIEGIGKTHQNFGMMIKYLLLPSVLGTFLYVNSLYLKHTEKFFLFFLCSLMQWILSLMFNARWLKFLLQRSTNTSPVCWRFGREEWLFCIKQIQIAFLICIIGFVAVALYSGISTALMMISFAVYPPLARILQNLELAAQILILFFSACYIYLRLGLYQVAIVEKEKKVLGIAWDLAKGKVFRLLSMKILLVIILSPLVFGIGLLLKFLVVIEMNLSKTTSFKSLFQPNILCSYFVLTSLTFVGIAYMLAVNTVIWEKLRSKHNLEEENQ